MKLSNASLCALLAVLELAREPDRQLSTSEIADKYGISSHHLAKVMRKLMEAGLVEAMRGASGGCRVAGDVNRMTLLDIIRPFEKLDFGFDIPNHRNYAS